MSVTDQAGGSSFAENGILGNVTQTLLFAVFYNRRRYLSSASEPHQQRNRTRLIATAADDGRGCVCHGAGGRTPPSPAGAGRAQSDAELLPFTYYSFAAEHQVINKGVRCKIRTRSCARAGLVLRARRATLAGSETRRDQQRTLQTSFRSRRQLL